MLKLDFIASYAKRIILGFRALIYATTSAFILATDARTDLAGKVARGIQSYLPLSLLLDDEVLSERHLELEFEILSWATGLGSIRGRY